MLGSSTVRSIVARGVYATLLALPLLVLAPTGRAWATDIVVTTTDDEENTDGDCSLREAIRAANLNQARDACPAGSSTERDTVTLASGATYSLTIPATVNDIDGLDGDLNLVNNSLAPADLLINVADGGTATISQDAVPGDRVFSTSTNGNFEIDDVTITGGTAPAGSGGGGVAVNSATVTLKRCVLTDNFAPNNGGAISAFGTGATLALDGCVFAGNVATNSGGAIITGSGTVTTINQTLFEDNVASNLSGGAIRNTGLLTITSSSFVDNRALFPGSGGAIENSASAADSVSITGSCFVGNNATAVSSFLVSAQDATGNWWGASDGPSGTGPGGGDAVSAAFDFSGFLSTPPTGCRPQQLVANGGFELDDDADALPDRWRTRRLQTPADGVSCTAGQCVLTIGGDGQSNQVLQTIDIAGEAGDFLKFSASSAATAVPATGGRYLIELLLIHADGSKQRKALKFSPGNHGPEEQSKALVANADYVRLKVRILYSRPSGTVRFDDVSVSLAAE